MAIDTGLSLLSWVWGVSPNLTPTHPHRRVRRQFFSESSQNRWESPIQPGNAGQRFHLDARREEPLVNTTRTMAAGLAAVAAVAVIGACSNSGTKEATSSPASAATPTSTSVQAAAQNQADMDFAHMMIPHHQQAIEMSDIILAKQGIDPPVVELAQQIKAAQGPEIETLQGWMKQWGMGGMPGMNHGGMSGMPGMDHSGMSGMPGASGAPTSTTTMPMPGGSMMPSGSMMPGMGHMSGMDGMMSAADMDALKNAEGVEAAKQYLTGMIKHHQGALTMAQEEIKNGQFPDAVAMAKSILESQQQEIDTMNQILGSL